MKLDGVSSGRAADCVLQVIGKSMKFVWYWRNGVYLEPFYPDRMAFMILTLWEIFCFVEQATAEVLDAVVSGMTKNCLMPHLI